MPGLEDSVILKNDLPYEVKDFFQAEIKAEDGYVTGYASTFHKKPDLVGDVVEPGAFAETIENRGVNGNGIKFLWQHNHLRPIGVPVDIREDGKGLYTKSMIAKDTQDGHDAFVFAKMGALDGFSIGYKIDDYERDERTGITKLKKLGLFEYSLVTFAANPRARITDVKTAIQSAKTPRQLETALRDLGLSKSASQYIVSLCRPSLKMADEGNLGDLLKTLKSVNAEIVVNRMINEAEVKTVVPYKSWPLAAEGASWDGSKEVRNADTKDLKVMSTWYDSENQDVKSAYKLPHHKVNGYQTVWKGVAAAMGALLGARGGVKIPVGDRKGVYTHLAKHYKEFEKTLPEFKECSTEELSKLTEKGIIL